jgi:ceramide glucosyltransferase
MGGFSVLGNYHSDDYVLGNLVARNGNTCLLSEHVIDHFILNSDPWHSLKHQVLWMKSTRFSRPRGHFGTLLTFSTPFAIIACAAALALREPRLAVCSLAVALLSRLAIAFTVGQFVVREPKTLWKMWLYPLRDLLAFGLWVASYGSRRVFWRGEWYELRGDGLFPVNPTKRLV